MSPAGMGQAEFDDGHGRPAVGVTNFDRSPEMSRTSNDNCLRSEQDIRTGGKAKLSNHENARYSLAMMVSVW